MAATDDVIEKGELEDTKVRRETICQERNVLTSTLQETEKDEEPDNKEGEGEEKKDECNTCKNDQEVVFIQVRDLTQPDSSGRSIIHFPPDRILASLSRWPHPGWSPSTSRCRAWSWSRRFTSS